jgi:hypothetical protein
MQFGNNMARAIPRRSPIREPQRSNIVAALRALQEEHGRRGAAALIGVCESFISYVTRGDASIGVETLLKLCEASGRSPNEILYGEEPVPSQPPLRADEARALRSVLDRLDPTG